MSSLDSVLYRLLHHRGYREAFCHKGPEGLGREDLDALGFIDREQLALTAAMVRDDLLRRTHRGSGTLAEMYPCTVGRWRSAHPEDVALHALAESFMESPAFEAYREVPYAGQGTSLEEAFFRFTEAEDIGDPAEREHEFVAAMVKALCLSPRPDFSLPPEVSAVAEGWYAVTARGEVILHAAIGGRLLVGPITPFLAELLTSRDDPREVAERHGVDGEALRASLEALRSMGLR